MYSRKCMMLVMFSLVFFTALVSAAASTSFCKCICGTESKIIALNGRASSTTSDADSPASPKTCADCNRQFCLDYNLPICKSKEDEEISTMCFQRDSAKDRAVVYTFIVLTVGLLAYAALRPWVDAKIESFQERRFNYGPVSAGNGNGQ